MTNSIETKSQTDNTRVRSFESLISPLEMQNKVPISKEIENNILKSRQGIHKCLSGDDKRLIIIVGPCSIHDTTAGLDYAKRLQTLAKQVEDKFLIVMRVYFEKPRTNVGFKGLISDPHIDKKTFDIDEGLRKRRGRLFT